MVSTISQHSKAKEVLGIKAIRSERIRRLSKEGFWIVLGQAVAVLGALVGVRLLTELLDPAAYGELALGMTLATLVNQTVLGPLGNGITRFYAPAVEQRDVGGYLNAVRRMVLTATGIIGLLILFAVAGLLVAGRTDWIAIAIAAFLFAILSGYTSILNGIQNAARQRSIVALHQGMESWARFLIAAALMVWLGATSTVAMVGYAMAGILVLASQHVFPPQFIFRRIAGAGKEKIWRDRILKYSWPMAVTGVMSWGFFASQRWALELFASTEDVGYFSAIFQIGFTPFSLAGGMLMTLIMPIVFGRAGDGSDKQKVNLVAASIIRFCLAASLIVLLLTALGAALHDVVFRWLVAEQYRAVSHYLPLAILAAGLLQISLILSTIILAETKTRRLLSLNTIGNSLVVAMTFLCTRFYTMDGLFVAMVGGSLIHLFWNIYNSYQVLKHE